ncbi:MAG: hypothetical protein NXI24_19435 [bacterium]|nr:hypothetical protein [bacterium]
MHRIKKIMPRLSLAALACSAAATLALIFIAPILEDRPLFVAGWLVAVTLLWLAGVACLDYHGLPEAGDSDFAAPGRGPLALILAAFVLAAFVFAPVYFSDDSVRHIHDGFYLLQGVDVYTTPPKSLPPFLDRLPNHPDVGTIYLPFTQLQAVVGAALHPRYGFLAVYYSVIFALLGLVWSRLRFGRERSIALAFIFSPAFLIPLAARHADVQGLLLVAAAVALLRTGDHAESQTNHDDARPPGLRRDGIFGRHALAAGLLALAAGLKPEGLLWAGTVGLYVFVLCVNDSFSPARRRGLYGFIVGGAVTGGGLALFAWMVLFPTPDAWQSFMRTVALFTDWFAAYNPILHARETLYPDVERPALLGIYRREVLLLALLWFLLPMHRFLRGVHGQAGAAQFLIGRLLVALLTASILSKGVWHPWYFLWLLPALWLTGRRRGAMFLAGALPLFYLPVIFLRATGEWWMPVFYGGVLAYAALFFVWWICAYKFFTNPAEKLRSVF